MLFDPCFVWFQVRNDALCGFEVKVAACMAVLRFFMGIIIIIHIVFCVVI